MTTPGPQVAVRTTSAATVYNRIFWLAYAANFAAVTANSLTFRFAEFVSLLGGTEQIAGAIVSAGTFGALAARLFLGQAIDRYGTRAVWSLAAAFFIVGCGMFLVIATSATGGTGRIGWPMYAARIAFATGLAGMFTCSVVHVQNLVPAPRRTEVIASLGSSGFLGIIAGSQLGDWMLSRLHPGGPEFLVLFGVSVSLGLLYLALVLYLTRDDVHLPPLETPAAHRLVFRYWPGPIVLVAIMMGVSFTTTTVFLTRFATALSLRGVGTFFTGYAVTAFAFRILSRRWTDQFGHRTVAVLGLLGHCAGCGVLPFVTAEWHFLIPAVLSGFGHALLFPVVVSVGSGAFPREYRGTGTTLVLGFVEVGAMLAGPVLGGIIDRFGFAPMFYSAGLTALVIAVVYAALEHRFPAKQHEAERVFAATLVSADPNARPSSPQDDRPMTGDDELVTLPFPHLGRSA